MNLDQAKEIITQHAPKELPSPYWFNFPRNRQRYRCIRAAF